MFWLVLSTSSLPANRVKSATFAAIRVLNLVFSSREADWFDRLPSGQIVFLFKEKKKSNKKPSKK